MPINDDKVRELVARGESATLDFKTTDYDWSATAKKDSNAELAKDLMAMANVLRADSEPAYIITGVTNTIPHTIQGVPPNSHVDDATLHQKVQGLLTTRRLSSPTTPSRLMVSPSVFTKCGRAVNRKYDGAPVRGTRVEIDDIEKMVDRVLAVLIAVRSAA